MKNQDLSVKYEFEINEKSALLESLLKNIKDQSRTTVKSYLSHRQVSINNVISTKFDASVNAGDVVRVRMGRAPEEFKHPMLRIVYEDEHIIIIDKRNGLLSMASSKQQTKTAYFILSEYIKRKDPQNRLFILHRLDRETSGLMMFAKSEQVQETMQKQWHDLVRERKYIAVVEGHLPEKQGVIHTLLTENAALKMYVPRDDENKGEPAITHYRVVRSSRNYSLVELELETGKKNQIRAHMEYMRTPIIGDKKYGASSKNSSGRVCLHAYVLNITHPITGEELDFSTRIPQLFESTIHS